ncbi:MAG TPA: M13 family metallopeptidase [Tepidisphaeraceae bacterium]|jgi:putative endopeptidase
MNVISRSLLFAIFLVSGTVISLAAETPLKSGVDRSAFDESVKPGQDFFSYVNGGWIKKNPIPADQSAWGVDQVLHEQTLLWLREIIESCGKESASSANARKIRDLYATATDEAKLQRDGAGPLREEFDAIARAQSVDQLIALIAHEHVNGLDVGFSFLINPDEKISSKYAVHLSQGGLGLPERGYYLDDDDEQKQIRTQYVQHVAKMFGLLGDSADAAKSEAAAVMEVETQLARASRTPVQLRDVEAQYNKKTLAELKKLSPKVNWDLYFKSIGGPELQEVIVGQPEFFEQFNKMLDGVSIADWHTYLRWHLIHEAAKRLSDPFVNEDFRFYGGVLSGLKELQPRWKRSIRAVDSLLGEALGELYVEKHFTGDAKQRAKTLVQNIVDAYRVRIEAVDWMAPETKKQAVAKLATVMRKIGYPDKFRDYSAYEVGTDSYVQNAFRYAAFDFRFWMHKLPEPVDKTLWEMTPPTINAYYEPSLNEIVFPAGILQPPYFDPTCDDALNYGAIGAVIGHEMTHGFDDQGCLFDAQGNMKNWWTADDKKRFDAKGAKLVKQFDACVAVDSIHVNGKLTLGENIADLGGLAIAYSAYQKSLGGKPAAVIDGFTADQRFFIGFGQSWRTHTRPETLKMRIRVDPHSPERFRVNVPVSNLRAFYDAFDIKPTDAMYRAPDQRVEVW